MRLAAALWSVVFLAVGCHPHTAEYDPALLAKVSEKVHEIEPLELAKADPNEVVPEPNEPPATVELSLEQCRALALENNLQLKASLISPTIAAAQLSEQEAKFESAFLASVSQTTREGQGINQYNQIYGTSNETLSTGLGVQVPLRTGGQVQFDLADSRISSNAPGNLADPYYSPYASFSFTQPLLRNAGKWVNTHSIRVAAYENQIVSARTKLEIIMVLASIDRVYWRLYAARGELEVRKQQHDLARAQLERVQRLVAADQQPEVEIIRAEAGVAQQLEAIIIAENNLRDRERETKRVANKVGLDIQSPTILIPTTQPDVIRYALDRKRLVETAMDARMELLELQLQILQDASSIDAARNQTLPAVAFEYSYNISAAAVTRSDAYDLLFDNIYNNERIGLQATIPIGNHAAKSRLRQAIYQRRQKLASRANRESTIKVEVLNAIDQVEANWQRILAARQNTILNARLYEAEQRQFEVGKRTSTEVLDAQTTFANAQSSEIVALAEYQISLVDLAYATGTILGAARIQWEPIVPPTDAD